MPTEFTTAHASVVSEGEFTPWTAPAPTPPAPGKPVINASLTSHVLWPPNHSMTDVGFSASASDADGNPIPIDVAVYSNEADHIPKYSDDGSPDAKDISESSLRLRAERNETPNGRVYLIVITAGAVSECLTVVVPSGGSVKAEAVVTNLAVEARASFMASGGVPAGFVSVGDGPLVGNKQ